MNDLNWLFNLAVGILCTFVGWKSKTSINKLNLMLGGANIVIALKTLINM